MPIYYTIKLFYLFGSRKSGKTKHIALRMILRIITDPEYNALAMRKVAGDIPDSIAEELLWATHTLFVSHLFTFTGKKKGYELKYKPTGQKIIMKGISINPATGQPTLSGLNVAQGGWIKDVWLEEAWEFTHADYKMIRGTVRGGAYSMLLVGNPYFKSIWCVKQAIDIFEPNLETLKTEGQMFFYQPEDTARAQRETIVHWSNLFINEKLSNEDLQERLEELRVNPKDAIVTVYGYPGNPSGSILGDLTDRIERVTLNYVINQSIGFKGGVDVGLENDAMTAFFGSRTANWHLIGIGEYYHSNGKQECNQNSDGGQWRFKDPHELGNDIIDFFLMYDTLWRKFGELKVAVDNADSAQISILNQETKLRGILGLKFVATKGNKYNKTRIETRIIFERNILAKRLFKILSIDGEDQIVRLIYEMETISWKQNNSNGTITLERDGSKVHPDMTNAWEYWFRPWRENVSKHYSFADNGL